MDGGDGSDRDTQERLENCQEALRAVRAENLQLRQSARAFGDLAERLNTALQREREAARERADPGRGLAAPEPDRRVGGAPSSPNES
jgi:hypothetical protein